MNGYLLALLSALIKWTNRNKAFLSKNQAFTEPSRDPYVDILGIPIKRSLSSLYLT